MQHALTFIAKLKTDTPEDRAKIQALDDLLNLIGKDIRGRRRGEDKNTYIDFTKFQTVHFMRWVLIPNDKTGSKEQLLFTTNYDGDLKTHLNELVDHVGETLDTIFGFCSGYPTNRMTDLERFRRDFRRFILKNSVDYAAFYIGYRGETFHQVRNYIAARRLLQEFFDLGDVQRFATSRIQQLLSHLPTKPTPRRNLLQWLFDQLAIVVRLVIFALDFLWHIVLIFVYRPLKHLILRREPALDLQLDSDLIDAKRPDVEEIEDVVTQNQMTVISKIKPGILPQIRLRIVLTAIHLVAKHYQNQGALGGIVTIHFARWAIIDKGRYLFFESNYDSSWESYIGEFVDRAASGMDLIWWTTPGYPEKGAQDIEAFKAIIRKNQLKTQTFYSSYPNDTIRNILNDRAISKGLEQSAVREWLQRF